MAKVNKCKTVKPSGKGIVRWHGAVSTNLMKQKVLTPKEELACGGDSDSFVACDKKKKGFAHKVKAALGKVMSSRQRETKLTKLSDTGTSRSELPFITERQNRLPEIIQHLSLPGDLTKGNVQRLPQTATLHLDINVVEAESEQITADKVLVHSRRMTKRVSVTSVPSGLQKVIYHTQHNWDIKQCTHFPFCNRVDFTLQPK